ncbi:MAG: hypothetical protein COA41_20175 [Sphingopyxis sp.]|nr:MAG: hypothetical protein COA41_20175 [Sphingopyxis sp.]
MQKALEAYVKRGHHGVGGWLEGFSPDFIMQLCQIQSENGIKGGIAEIGVHHGRLFILMSLATADDELGLAIDLYDDQHLNTDSSGRGDEAIFRRNMVKNGADLERTIVFKKNSLEIRPDEVVSRIGNPRLFSVDGGHTEECAYSDLRLAEGCLAEKGVIILDDFFNWFWPGVAAGTMKYLLEGGAFRPFALTNNKMYLCRAEFAGWYTERLRTSFPAHIFDKTVEVAGDPVSMFGYHDTFLSPISRLKRRFSHTETFKRIRGRVKATSAS